MKLLSLLFLSFGLTAMQSPTPRIVIIKVDGLNADLLESTIKQTSPETGKSRLPWMDYIFRQNGTVFRNFYVRGISLSAPSWAMLDTGQHSIIRGNVEYDRYNGEVYDYLNFFPFYVENARSRQPDMPGVRVLDRAGIPLLLDRFPDHLQSFQLFQRDVDWNLLAKAAKRRFSSKTLLASLETGDAPTLDSALETQEQVKLLADLQNPAIRYLDFYTGDVDHEGHATNQQEALAKQLEILDAFIGRVWTTIQQTHIPTILAVVSDHGMNNDPGVISQGYNLPDLLNSPDGGGHHVITNRHQLSDFKLRGLNPLVHRVVTPSLASYYLKNQAEQYPTAWIDLDGNERASLHLRNSDWNEIQILSQQHTPAAVTMISEIVKRNREVWSREIGQLQEAPGGYEHFLSAMRSLLDGSGKIPPMSLGDRNTIYQLQNYAVGAAPGPVTDEAHSFIRINYFDLLTSRTVRNNPGRLNPNPIDFIAATLPDAAAPLFDPKAEHAYWLTSAQDRQIVVLTNASDEIRVVPIKHLTQSQDGAFHFTQQAWRPGLPLRLFEDAALKVPDHQHWLSPWHSEREWLRATHLCRYSNGVIGITEQLSPVASNVPGSNFERLRRDLVQPDLQIFAADHWNFNARNFNPGGNHGSFLRISTHSVWMMAGDGIAHASIDEPYDTLNFASTVLHLAGKEPPMPARVVIP